MAELITPISYWILTLLWMVILVLYLVKLRQSKVTGGAVAVLLIILAIDAFRTVFESVYFGLYFNSLYGLIPKQIHDVLSQPSLVIIPKLINIIAGFLVLFLLASRWVPKEIHDREQGVQDLQQAVKAAEENQTNLTAILDGITDAIVFVTPDRKIVSINHALEKIFGYNIDDLAGKTTSVLYESDEEYERQGQLRFNLSAEQNSQRYEVNYRRKNGELFVGETLGTAIKTKVGEVLGYIGVMRDVSEQHKADAQ